MGSLLTTRIEEAKAKGRKAVIPYLPFCHPDCERFWTEIEGMDAAGADVIEVGVPFSDPVADGPVIEEAVNECLERGACLKGILDGLAERKGKLHAAIVLMGYVNPFMQYGWEKFAADAAAAGVSGLIVPDLPYEEAGEIKALLRAQGLDLVPLVGLNTSADRLALYAEDASGFAYFVSVLGTTGARDSLPEEVFEKLTLARKAFTVPLALGFGIKTPEQAARFGDLADAVVIGSAIVSHTKAGGSAAQFLAPFLK
ncbi:Tryptophan synthase alpha chain [Desulfovibrio sp. X2]|uniref:tryptophan synthase subunit alpha n=1 Tax=Desulfovibrio sp. X2 TaxID=941449 RepID=UPI0003587532|nr:tryptophan synthase subunit alpha [Desulfovibrio sp. X2]EPR36302.1 Tryptophan synthase alpha chain [Desulfovibrio sp. X2]